MRYKSADGIPSQETVAASYMAFPLKFYWFIQHGYVPHVYQSVFHGLRREDGRLVRFRHLAAGRRGGKTLGAAWEIVYYCMHPEAYYQDFYGKDWDGTPLWIWALCKDYKLGRPSYLTFLSVLRQAGLVHGRDYKLHKGERYVEFYASDGSSLALVEFKTADDPESLRGAGLDLLWIDEAAFITSQTAWDVVYPSLSDKQGGVLTTTTPAGKNWLWEVAFAPKSVDDPSHGSVEYRSIDNPHFIAAEWEYAKTHLHPMIFAQEYMAAFDAYQGIELLGEWLHYYTAGEPTHPDDVRLPRNDAGGTKLRKFIGIDPAISLSDTADRFVMALIGVHDQSGQAFLLDLYARRIPFPEQLQMIRTWFYKYRPEVIGIETNAYQAALAQMAQTMHGWPPISAVVSKGKKSERILRMSPLFQIGKVRIHRSQVDFIEEWINYDSQVKNPHDDTLDAVEIALRTAGALLPDMDFNTRVQISDEWRGSSSLAEIAQNEIASLKKGERKSRGWDDEMGDYW